MVQVQRKGAVTSGWCRKTFDVTYDTATIINNSTNLITISEPSVIADDVTVSVVEKQKGRYFTIELNFPPGFELPGDQPGMLTINTTHPQFSTVKVPIFQTSQPAR